MFRFLPEELVLLCNCLILTQCNYVFSFQLMVIASFSSFACHVTASQRLKMQMMRGSGCWLSPFFIKTHLSWAFRSSLGKKEFRQAPIPAPSYLTYLCCCLVNQLCLTLCDLMACSLPSSPVHEISEARMLEWVAVFVSNLPILFKSILY